jgi:glycine cleavage system transcriptional repressor
MATMPMAMTHIQDALVITAAGEDRVGLVDNFTGRIAVAGCNIEESRMAVLGGHFAFIMRVSGRWDALAKLEGQLGEIGAHLGLSIVHKRTGERESGRQVIPYHVEVISVDHPGIVNGLSGFFARRGINIEELGTDTYSAAHSGTRMIAVRITVGVPAEMHIAELRNDFLDHCDAQNLDATFEPVRS